MVYSLEKKKDGERKGGEKIEALFFCRSQLIWRSSTLDKQQERSLLNLPSNLRNHFIMHRKSALFDNRNVHNILKYVVLTFCLRKTKYLAVIDLTFFSSPHRIDTINMWVCEETVFQVV